MNAPGRHAARFRDRVSSRRSAKNRRADAKRDGPCSLVECPEAVRAGSPRSFSSSSSSLCPHVVASRSSGAPCPASTVPHAVHRIWCAARCASIRARTRGTAAHAVERARPESAARRRRASRVVRSVSSTARAHVSMRRSISTTAARAVPCVRSARSARAVRATRRAGLSRAARRRVSGRTARMSRAIATTAGCAVASAVSGRRASMEAAACSARPARCSAWTDVPTSARISRTAAPAALRARRAKCARREAARCRAEVASPTARVSAPISARASRVVVRAVSRAPRARCARRVRASPRVARASRTAVACAETSRRIG